MLRWKLHILMAEKRITNKELAELSGMHPTSISKLKTVDEVERISSRTIDALCNGLNKAYRARGDMRLITPNDLFNYTFSDGGDDPSAPCPTDPINNGVASEAKNQGKSQGSKTAKRSQRPKSSMGHLIQLPVKKVG